MRFLDLLRGCSTNLHEEVEQAQEGNEDGHQRCGDEDDDTSAHHVEHRTHEHLDYVGDHRVNGVHLLGKAVDQVATGRPLEEGHG